MVYNFNLGIGWASSGVEYAQSYRANLLRRAHIPARFVFTDMFPTENIEHMHNAYYTADTNTFKESEYADMAEALNLTLAMPHLIDEALAMQKKAAVAADATDYMEILHL